MNKILIILVVMVGLFALRPSTSEAPTVATSTPSTAIVATSSPATTTPKKTATKKVPAPTTPKKKAASPVTPKPSPTVTTPPTPTSPQPEPTRPTTSTAPTLSIPSLEARIHTLINKERAAQGLSTLAWQPALLPIARAHSTDMAARNYFAHESPEGQNFRERYEEGGFDCQVRVGNTIHLGAENLFQNNTYDSWTEINGVRTYDWNTEEEIAQSTVQGWMNSPGHRKNILTAHWLTEAIGVAFSSNDEILITQNFC